MHRVQTVSVLRVLSTRQRTFCRFGCHVRLVLLLAWETLFPTLRRLPQTSQTLATFFTSPLGSNAAF